MDEVSEFGKGCFRPVVGEIVVVGVAEVVDSGICKKRLRQVQSDAEAAGIHRNFQHRPSRRRAEFVSLQQLGYAGQVLSYLPVGGSPSEGVGQMPVSVLCQGGRCTQR
ncbi:hypothetical protein ACFYWF_01365 [Streptomyces sp. NPDC003344]|uniref:hypothetical protein n=1 Tax=Streptomyces sp. NPDC003344 TaxID=3364682 RepID=UPI0036B70C40